MPYNIMISDKMKELVLRYRVPLEYVYRLLGDDECISCPSPMKVAICEEIFLAGFFLPLYPSLERLFIKYGLVSA